MEVRKRDLALLLVLACLALLAALGIHSFFGGPEGQREARVLPEPRRPETVFPLVPANSRTTLEDLLRIFSAVAAEPLAQRFADDFHRDPVLRELWRRLRENGRTDEFARGLRDSPEFASLLQRYAGQAGFRELSERVAAEMDLSALVSNPASPASSRTLIAHPESARAGDPPAGAAARADRRPGAPGAATAAAAGREGDGKGGLIKDREEIVRLYRLWEHDALTKLEKPKDAASEKMERLLARYPFLASSFTDEELRRLVAGVEAHGSLWGACLMLDWLAKCTQACQTAASCSIPGGSLWAACMDSFGDELRCVRVCNTQPPCDVSDAVWDRVCQAPLRAYPPRPSPPECLGGTRKPIPPPPTPPPTGRGCETCTWGPWEACGSAGCGPGRRGRRRICPPSATGCQMTDCWTDGSGCEPTPTPCPPPGPALVCVNGVRRRWSSATCRYEDLMTPAVMPSCADGYVPVYDSTTCRWDCKKAPS